MPDGRDAPIFPGDDPTRSWSNVRLFVPNLLPLVAARFSPAQTSELLEVLQDQMSSAAHARLEVARDLLHEGVQHGDQYADPEYRRGYLDGMKWLFEAVPNVAPLVAHQDLEAGHVGRLERLGFKKGEAYSLIQQVLAYEAGLLEDIVADDERIPIGNREDSFFEDPVYLDGMSMALAFEFDAICYFDGAGFPGVDTMPKLSVVRLQIGECLHQTLPQLAELADVYSRELDRSRGDDLV